MEDQVKFEKELFKLGGSTATAIPKELINFLGLNVGDTLVMIGENGKKGKFIAIWKGD